MEVTVAKSAGFCFGVKRAVDMVYEEAKKNTIAGLRSAEGYIRRQLAKTVNLRNTPEIRFILDESIEYGVSMSKLIDEVTHKDAAGEVQEDGEISE